MKNQKITPLLDELKMMIVKRHEGKDSGLAMGMLLPVEGALLKRFVLPEEREELLLIDLDD